MKKALCMMMVTMLVLALGITVYARYEVCPICEGRMTESSYTKSKTVPCEITDDPDMKDTIVTTYYVLKCGDCGYSETSDDGGERHCSH